MKKAFHSMADSLKQKTLFFKSASLIIASALLVGAAFAPTVSAAEADSGYDTKNTTVYSSIDAVTSSGISESNKTSRWKFAADTSNYNDFFAVTTNDFSLDANAVEAGIEISWTSPDGAEGDTVLRISDGASYNRKLKVSGSSYIATDFSVGATYDIQVVIGEYASELLSYGNTMIPVTVMSSSGNKAAFTHNNGAVYTNFLIDLGDAKKYVSDKAGVLIQIDMSLLEDKEVYFNYTATAGEYVGKTYSSHDAWFQFSSNLNAMDVGEDGDWSVLPDSTANTVDGTNNAFIIDETSGIYQAINHGAKSKAITNGDMNITYTGGTAYTDEKSTGFRSGYLLIPFDHYNETIISQIASNGNICYTTENYNYIYYTRQNSTATVEDKNIHIPKIADLAEGYTIDNNGTNTAVRTLFDRDITISGVTLITDYAGFVSANIDTENKSFSAGIPKSETNISDGGYMTANGNLLSSVYCSTTGKYTDYNSGYSFNVASGETAKIGFTAPTDGYYEISDTLTAASDAGASYRAVLESLDGDRMLLQEARDISSGDGKLVLLSKLNAGDTVYIEAWADTADAEISFGLPKAVKINNMTDGSYASTPIDYYITKNNDSIEYKTSVMTQHQMTWNFKWFLNPVSVTDSTGTTVYTEEKYLNNEGITAAVRDGFASATSVDYDTLGIADLNAGDDGTKLINALKDYDFYYAGGNMAYMAKLATISGANTDGTIKYSNGSGTRNHTVNGFLSLATSGSVTAVSSAEAANLAYGFGYNRGIDNSKYYFYNMGVAFEWTAPASGTVDVSGMSRTAGGSQIILVNNEVAAALHKDNKTAIDVIAVEKGDVVTVAYDITDGGYDGSRTRGIPTITFTPDVSNITVKGDTVATELVGGLLANGTEITLPEFIKQGTLFRYWKIASDESAELLAGDLYTVENDDTLTAVFSYYGDLDENNDVNASDLTVLKKHLLGCETITDEILEIADVKSDGNIDLLDLIRMKKYLAGYAVVLGAE